MLLNIRDNTLLHHATWINNHILVKLLLSVGYDPNAKNKNDETPLHHAAEVGTSLKIILALLEKGANPKAEDYLGTKPIDKAVFNDRYGYEIKNMLIEYEPPETHQEIHEFFFLSGHGAKNLELIKDKS